MSKPIVLHTFGLSVWSAAAELAVAELDLEDQVEKNVVDLVAGANFSPSFVKLNPNATLPTLEAKGKVFTNTTDVVDYLVHHASRKVAPRTALTDTIHEEQYDPNFPLLLTRHEEEFQAKASGFPAQFGTNRQEALEKYAVTPEAAEHKTFYDAKIAGNGDLVAIYQGKVPEQVKHDFFAKSNGHWDRLRAFILEILPAALPDSGFLGGAVPGEDDFHVGAWLARISFTAGAENSPAGVNALEKDLGVPVPTKVVTYWTAWNARPSWQAVYGDGLH